MIHSLVESQSGIDNIQVPHCSSVSHVNTLCNRNELILIRQIHMNPHKSNKQTYIIGTMPL